MQVTQYTDYGLRLLIYLAISDEGATVGQVAEHYGISKNHLVKVAHRLVQLGYIESTRGRSGGLHLVRDPKTISIGDVVRKLETNMSIVECFDEEKNTCPLAGQCGLEGALHEATAAFLKVLDARSLADMTRNRKQLAKILLVKNS